MFLFILDWMGVDHRLFTGLVEGTAQVKMVSRFENTSKRTYARAHTKIYIDLGRLAKGLKVGDSVSVNGVCVTITKLSRRSAEFEIVGETVRKSNLGSARPGDKVNIERSLRLGDRLEGHFVLGHVDGTGTIDDIKKLPAETLFWIKVSNKRLLSSIVSKGSISIDGVSLTLVQVVRDRISVSIIPHTLEVTTLGFKSTGDVVNIETDVLAKYVSACLSFALPIK